MRPAALLEKLVAFETVSSEPNRSLIDFCAALLKDSGAEVCVIETPGMPGKANLWARLGPAGPGGIALAGHTDVVPTQGQSWSAAPFTLTRREEAFYGRGACDMKGFLGCALALAEGFKNAPPRKPVYIALTHDEETGMHGARTLAEWIARQGDAAGRPDFVWLGEPTGMAPVIAHKGVCGTLTTFTGAAAHSSRPDLGCSAIAMASDFLLWLGQETARAAAAPWPGSPFDPPFTSFNAGVISGGKAINIIPDACQVGWEYRLHPGEDAAGLVARYEACLEAILSKARLRCPNAAVSSRQTIDNPPFSTPTDHPAVALLLRLSGTPTAGAVPYGTEACFFQNWAPPIICGPGFIDQAHQPDEFVSIEQLSMCEKMLAQAVEVW